MPTNVCIDVDLTVVDEKGELLSGVSEALVRLRQANCRLTLWSAAGAEYAKSVAVKHGLEVFFEGFAGKPDIAIDDEPESTQPRVVFPFNADTQWGEITEEILQKCRE